MRIVAVAILVALMPTLVYSQTDTTGVDTSAADTLAPVYYRKEKPKRAQKKLVLKGHTLTDRLVAIEVEAPYTGVLEFTLKDPSDAVLYFNEYICKIGANTIRLSRKAFDKSGPGVYNYVIRYKEENYTDNLTIEGEAEAGAGG